MADLYRNPKGWRTISVEVVTDGKTIALIGDPPECDPLDSEHSCDAMGCGLAHVLAYVLLDSFAARAIAHLPGHPRDVRAVVEPRESLREQVLRRLGRTKEAEATKS